MSHNEYQDCPKCGEINCVGLSAITEEIRTFEPDGIISGDDIDIKVCSNCGNVTTDPCIPDPKGLLRARLGYLLRLRSEQAITRAYRQKYGA